MVNINIVYGVLYGRQDNQIILDKLKIYLLRINNPLNGINQLILVYQV